MAPGSPCYVYVKLFPRLARSQAAGAAWQSPGDRTQLHKVQRSHGLRSASRWQGPLFKFNENKGEFLFKVQEENASSETTLVGGSGGGVVDPAVEGGGPACTSQARKEERPGAGLRSQHSARARRSSRCVRVAAPAGRRGRGADARLCPLPAGVRGGGWEKLATGVSYREGRLTLVLSVLATGRKPAPPFLLYNKCSWPCPAGAPSFPLRRAPKR